MIVVYCGALRVYVCRWFDLTLSKLTLVILFFFSFYVCNLLLNLPPLFTQTLAESDTCTQFHTRAATPTYTCHGMLLQNKLLELFLLWLYFPSLDSHTVDLLFSLERLLFIYSRVVFFYSWYFLFVYNLIGWKVLKKNTHRTKSTFMRVINSPSIGYIFEWWDTIQMVETTQDN